MAARVQKSKIGQIWPHKSGSAFGSRSSDLDKFWHGHTTWPFKQACERIFHLSQNPRWPPGDKGQKSTEFEPTNHISAQYLDIFHQILTKFGMAILLDPKDKSAREFLIYRPNLTPQITFRLGIWFPFIWFGQILAWTYYLTLKIDGRRGSKVQKRPNLTPQITFRLSIWFLYDRFGQN